ncbi:MAG: S46 family peptidase, partial [Bryobacter sp.]|nr:S46 family peptidase [Bryobacter sp.]
MVFYIRSFALAALCCAMPAAADEGMWLLNRFPAKAVQEKYKFPVTDAFLETMRLGSVRFNSGGSGSFVSPDGMLFTNHHVAFDCIQKISTKENDYVKNGFFAKSHAEEKACPDLEINVLLSIETVTDQVNAGIAAGAPPAEASQKKRENQSMIEKACSDKTGNRCDVVALFSGGQYDLYQYKKYTDIRLVFAPEFAIAFFGGDPDNFTYPRWNLDITFFRAYENGKPAKPARYLPFSKTGAKDGELVFVSGHPGQTGRLETLAQLEFNRDVLYPLVLGRLNGLVKMLLAFGAQSEENKRIAADDLFGYQNSQKAYTGFQGGLLDNNLMARKRDEERRLRAAIADDPAKQKLYGTTWDEIAAAYADYRTFVKPYTVWERYGETASHLLTVGRKILRYAEEKQKPSEQRLREFVDSALASREQEMYSTAPVHPTLEVALIERFLEYAVETLGADDANVRAILKGRTPRAAAEAAVNSSKLADVAVRKQLAASADAARNSEDGIMALVRLIDGPAREALKKYLDRVDAVQRTAAAKVAQAKFAVSGAGDYPDATFTLRVSYGPIKGYKNA